MLFPSSPHCFKKRFFNGETGCEMGHPRMQFSVFRIQYSDFSPLPRPEGVSMRKHDSPVESSPYLGSLPDNALSLGRVRTQIFVAQGWWAGWELWILKQNPWVQTFLSQALKVLAQVLHSLLVGTQAFSSCPLLGKLSCQACHDWGSSGEQWGQSWNSQTSAYRRASIKQ